MLVVTLASQAQPVFVDLRSHVGGRWALETDLEDDEDVDEDEEVTVKKLT